MITLSDTQQAVYDDMVHKTHHFRGRYECVMMGYAGTGKSTLISKYIEDMSNYYSIATTSPTHKANAVLRNMIDETDTHPEQVVISTIHSFLGLKLVYEKNRAVLKHDPQSKNSNTKVDILIVDECSMISDKLYQHIVQQSYRVRRAIIFVGDPCQLPPVETEDVTDASNLSPTFDLKNQYFLSEVRRQALDNPILRIATEIRECIGTGLDPMLIMNQIDLLDTVARVDDDDFLSLYKSYNESETLRELYDRVSVNKMVSYTNSVVNNFNIIMRNWLLPDEIGKEFKKGEPIVFETVTQHCPYTVQEMIQCPDFQPESFLGIECWKFKLSANKSILVVGPETVGAYNDYMHQLANDINNKVLNPLTKKPYAWQDYYIIREKINVVNYPYAITVHKSQGSTFDNLWLDLTYVDRIKDHDSKCRILYTAMTRPKNLVLFK